MENKVKILKTKKGFLKNEILIESLGNCGIVFGSFFGDRLFYLVKGERKWVKVSKSFAYCEGETIDFWEICKSSSVWQFSWVFC